MSKRFVGFRKIENSDTVENGKAEHSVIVFMAALIQDI